MEALFRAVSGAIALALEGLSVLMIVIGAMEAIWRVLPALARINSTQSQGLRRQAWLSLARWLLLGLEFMLAADIVRTAIAPTWDDIGRLGAIALIRTALNYFLERDMEEFSPEIDEEPKSDT